MFVELPPEHRPHEPLARFLARWHGLDVTPDAAAKLPSWWRAVLRRHPDLFARTQNHLVSSVERVDDDPFLVWEGARTVERALPGLEVFYVEAEGAVTWAASTDGADPAVWARVGDRHGAVAWRTEKDPLSRVLLKAVLLESMFGAEQGGVIDYLPKRDWERIVARGLAPLSFASEPGLWPTFYQADDHVAAVFEEGGPDVRVMFAAPVVGALDFLGDEIDNAYDFGL